MIKTNPLTKQQRRKAAAMAASTIDRIGVPRMQCVPDKDGHTVLLVARAAGLTEGRVQYYLRVLRMDMGNALVRELVVDGVAGYKRLLAGIGRGHDGTKDKRPTVLGRRLREEGMAL